MSSKPLQIWDETICNGHIKAHHRSWYSKLCSRNNGNKCLDKFIVCPAEVKNTLGIKVSFLVMILKNLKKYFTFKIHVQVLDDKNVWRRFWTLNYQWTTCVKPFRCTMPMCLEKPDSVQSFRFHYEGKWNKLYQNMKGSDPHFVGFKEYAF